MEAPRKVPVAQEGRPRGPDICRKTRGWCSQHRGQSPGGELGGKDARDRREDDELRGEGAHAGAEHCKLVMIVNLDKIKWHQKCM